VPGTKYDVQPPVTLATGEWKRMTEAERIDHENARIMHRKQPGVLGGRMPGNPNVLPYGAVKALRAAKFRVKKDLPPDVQEAAAEVAGYAFERLVQVMGGTINSKKSPSILKAVTAVREEICDPVVKEARISGTLSLEDLVSKAGLLAKADAKGGKK
jgi:hypothetical protein